MRLAYGFNKEILMRTDDDFSEMMNDLKHRFRQWRGQGQGAMILFGVAALVVVVLVFQAFVVVGAGERAVIYSKLSGVLQLQRGEGLNPNVPFLWEPVKYDVKTMTYTMSAQQAEGQVRGDDSLLALTSDGLPVKLDVSIRFHVMPDEVWKLHQEIGPGYIDKIVRPVSRSGIRMVLSRYTVTEVYSGARQKIKDDIEKLLEPKFAAAYLQLDEVLPRDVQFSTQFQQAIEDKQVAQQEASRMVFVLQQAKLERERRIVEAQGEAGAIRLRARALGRNPQLVQYEYVKGLPDNVQTVIADTNTIINFSSLFTGAAGQ
jgi:regulator of protease activity HflC (stomatin/prohibitin superfamily)